MNKSTINICIQVFVGKPEKDYAQWKKIQMQKTKYCILLFIWHYKRGKITVTKIWSIRRRWKTAKEHKEIWGWWKCSITWFGWWLHYYINLSHSSNCKNLLYTNYTLTKPTKKGERQLLISRMLTVQSQLISWLMVCNLSHWC